MSAADLAAYVLSDGVPPSDAALGYLANCWDEAAALVAQHVGGTLAPGLPATEAAPGSAADFPGDYWTAPGTPPALGNGGTVVIAEGFPASILHRAILQVGAELYERRKARSGISQFGMPDQSTARLSRDPMEATYPILRPYLGHAIA